MEALGLLFVGTTLLLLIGHIAEIFGAHSSAGNNSVRLDALFRYVLVTMQRDLQPPRRAGARAALRT